MINKSILLLTLILGISLTTLPARADTSSDESDEPAEVHSTANGDETEGSTVKFEYKYLKCGIRLAQGDSKNPESTMICASVENACENKAEYYLKCRVEYVTIKKKITPYINSCAPACQKSAGFDTQH